MPRVHGARLPLIALCLIALASPLAARAQEGAKIPSPAERRAELRPLYDQMQTDPEIAALRRQLAANGKDAALIDRVLQAMPISPLDYLEIDMQARHYEIPVAKFVYVQHKRWMELHRPAAEKLYGSAYVEGLLSGWGVDTSRPEPGAPSPNKVLTSLNRNVASPAAEDYEGEIQVAVNPSNLNQLVAASNNWENDQGTDLAIFFSSDGGTTWSYTTAPTSTAYSGFPSCSGIELGGDPAVFWNDNNQVFVNYMLICATAFDTLTSMVVARSDDGGANWVAQGVIKQSWVTGTFEDKNFYVIDNYAASPYHGRHYTCWDRDNNEKIAYSTNNGVSWTEVNVPSAAAGTLDLGCEMAVENNGTLHLIFDTLDCGASSCSNERMFYTKSTTGGTSWTTPVLVRDFNLVSFSGANFPDAQDSRGINPFGAIDVDNSGGACDGRLYVTYTDVPAGKTANDAEVYLATSTNGGTSWSSGLKINDDLLNGRAQFHPTLQVDQSNGHVIVAWHDARHDSGNDSVQAYVGRSLDCGASFEGNEQVTRVSNEFNNWTWSFTNENTSDNPNFNPNQFGEYLGLDVKNGKAYVAWCDTRQFFPNFTTDTEKENLGFAVVDFTTGSTRLNFKSIFSQDGWVAESGENTNAGGGFNSSQAGPAGLIVGDTLADTQFKSIVAFDTSPIPNAATVTVAKLRLRRGTVVGSNPFTVLGNLRADVKTGFFNGNSALEAADFQAAATATAVCTMTNPANDGDWSECSFNAAGLAAINKTGTTQIRVAFSTDDNDDLSADYMGFIPGDTLFSDEMPTLEVTFQ